MWASNHHSWWDAFVAAVLLWGSGRHITVLMEPANLARFTFLRRLGTRGTDELRAAVRALQAGRVVIVFPEGSLRAPGPLAPLQPGAAWLAGRAEVPLVAVAVRVVMRGHQAPEAYLDLEPVAGDGLETVLARRLSTLDEALRQAEPRSPLPGFERALGGERSWDERLARRRRA